MLRAGLAGRGVVEYVVAAAGGFGEGGGVEAQAGGDLVSLDLDHLAALALVGLPAALAQPASHQHAGALGERLGGVLGLGAPDTLTGPRGGVARSPETANDSGQSRLGRGAPTARPH